MIYALIFIFLIFVFYICRREESKFKECIEKQYYDKGIYCMNPLQGEKAVKMARKGVLLAKYLPWAILVVLVLSALKAKSA